MTVSLSTVWSFVVKVWSGIGPLVGVLIGSWLTRSWQLKQWVLDGKKTEYRELISTLSGSYNRIVNNWPSATLVTAEERRKQVEAVVAGRQVIEDRIFSVKQMRVENVRELWEQLTAEKDPARHGHYWDELHDVLVKMAHRDLRIEG
jgi:hypothetical protein